MKKLSVIIPVYNVERYLEKCLETVFMIEEKEKEIIIVNDGSIDESYKIIDKYEKKYREITKVINQKNAGISSARNTGLLHATGKYIMFLDSDDYINPKKVVELLEAGEKEELDILMGKTLKIWDNFSKEEELNSLNVNDILTGKEYLVESLKKRCHRIEVWNYLYKRKFLEDNNLKFKEKIIHEDSLFSIKALIQAKKVKCLKKTHYYYRQREGSIMKKLDTRSNQSKAIVIGELIYFFESKNLNEKYLNNYLVGMALKAYEYLDKRTLKKLNNLEIIGIRARIKRIILNLKILK